MPPMGGNFMPPYPPSAYHSSTTSYTGYPPYPQGSNTGYPPYPTPYPPYPTPGGYGQQPSMTPDMTATGTIKDEHIRESLLTAIEEKLLRKMREQFQQNQAELDTLKRTQEELKQGKVKLEGILNKMEREQVCFINCF